ncbi:MAG: hypothetical protein ACI8ZB_001248 [Desulforhopalus sp.]|jgi:hypothetical protein
MNSRDSQHLKHLFILILISLFFSGCAQLPEYAQPHLSVEPFAPSLQFVGYRQLRVNDFKAATPAPSIRDHSHMINAHTSVSLRPVTEIQYIITPPHSNFGLYKAYLQELTFKAIMVPNRSWWNPQLAPEKTTYVLQHEQIHFALMEIAARKLNKKMGLSGGQSVSATTRDTVEQLLMTAVEQEITATQKEILQEHTAFDEDTSLHYDPEHQQQWYDDSIKKLNDLSRWAR